MIKDFIQVFNLFKQFKQEIIKLQDKITTLEEKIKYLEERLDYVEADPFKMPFG